MAKRLKCFSRKLLPFIITGLTILATVTVANFSLLHPQSVNAQQVSRGNGYVSIQLPSTGNQDDNWSCGPNSAARVLAFYGRNVDYNTVRSAVNREFMLPPSVNVPAPTLTNPLRTRRVDIRTGTTPHVLRDVMQQWEGRNVRLERGADFSSLLSLLREGKPIVTLIRDGSIPPETTLSGTWPVLHWITITGFDERGGDRLIYYTDTDGGKYQYTYDQFLEKWNWSVGRGFASESLSRNGVQSRTMIWVGRTPPSLVSSATPIAGIPIPVNSGNTLFYDRSNGVCAFTASNGSVIQRLTTCRRTWHSIIYTAGKLLFYDRDAGQIETYRVGNQGLGAQLHSYARGSMRRTWAQITSPSEGIIVFRDDNGQVETYRLNDIGMLQGL